MKQRIMREEGTENLLECLGCTSFRWYFPDGKAHQLGTRQHPHIKEEWEEKFDKKFLDHSDPSIVSHARELKSFIRHALKQQAEEMLFIVEREKNKKTLIQTIKRYL